MVKDGIKPRKSQMELHHSLLLKASLVGRKVNSLTVISSYSICHSWKDGWLCKSKCAVVVPHQVIWDTLPITKIYLFVNSISIFLSKGYFGKFKGQLTPQNEPFSGQVASNVKVKNPHFRAERVSVFLKFPLENLTYIALTAAILHFYRGFRKIR